MNGTTWLIIAICAVAAFAYAFILDKKAGKGFNTKKYLALLVCLVIAIVSTWLASLQAYVGAPMIALLIGMIVVNLMPKVDKDFKAGTTVASKKFLNLGIILVGGTLNFAGIVAATRALPLVIFNICLSFAVAFLLGRYALKVSNKICCLVGGGTCICGGTAIAALSNIIHAAEEEIGYAMTSIFLFDVFSCLLYPYLAGWLGLSNQQFAFLSGTAINDTSSVVAANSTYSALNNIDFNGGTTVKLVRTTMLIVLAVIVTIITVRQEAKNSKSSGSNVSIGATVLKVFPWFILGFLVMAILNTFGVFGFLGSFPLFSKGSKFFITMALAGVGFKMQFKDLFTKGVKPILLGGCTWLAVAASSMTFIYLFKDYVNATTF